MNETTRNTPLNTDGWVALACASACRLSCPSCSRRGDGSDTPTEENLFALQVLAEQGFTSVLLTGTEPIGRNDLPLLIREARRFGFQTVWAADCGYALNERPVDLKALGLDGLLLLFRGVSPSRVDHFTATSEGAVRLRAGLEHLKRSGLAWHGLVELVRPILPELPAVLETIARHGGRGVSFHIPAMASMEPFGLAVPERLAARAAANMSETATRLGLETGPHAAVSAWTQAVSPHSLMRERGLDASRVRLMMSPDPEDFLSVGVHRSPNGTIRGEILMRIIGACDMNCLFCWLHNEGGPVPLKRLMDVVHEQRRVLEAQGVEETTVVLSGGEPTLHPGLVELTAWLAALPNIIVELQTNAARLAEPGRAAALREAGLASAQVTLLSADPDISDAMTGRKGAWEKTVTGLDRLIETGLPVSLSIVVAKRNLSSLPDTLAFIARRWGDRRSDVRVNLLMAMPMNRLRELDIRAMTPSVGEARPYLERAFVQGEAMGLRFGMFDVPCGFPLCAYGDAALRLPCASSRATSNEGETLAGYRKPPVCDDCALLPLCPGVLDRVAEEYGTNDLRPIRR